MEPVSMRFNEVCEGFDVITWKPFYVFVQNCNYQKKPFWLATQH